MAEVTLSQQDALKFFIEQIRLFMQDNIKANKLLGSLEYSDRSVLQAIHMTLSDYNSTGPAAGSLRVEKWVEFPSLTLMILGASRELLLSAILLSGRNALNFQDSGGVTLSDQDQWQRYPTFYQMIDQRYQTLKLSVIRTKNMNNGFDSHSSEYSLINELSILYRDYNLINV